MKSPNKYRFSLQWGVETAEKVQAGEMLESLGNRKSEFVVMAVTDYIVNHPETLSPLQKLRIVVKPSYTREELESLVRKVIEEKLASEKLTVSDTSLQKSNETTSETDIDAMIQNLELFLP
jgi:hypothetical protein